MIEKINTNDEVNRIIDNIKNIETQIDSLNKKNKFLFLYHNKKINERINKLENIKKSLYIKLEKIIDKNLLYK